MSSGRGDCSRSSETLREGLATCCWLGKVPVAPGTCGTLGAAVVFAAMETLRRALEWEPAVSTAALAALAVMSFAVAVGLGAWAQQVWSAKDPQAFVLDEAAGFFVAAVPLPVLFPGVSQWWVVAVAFGTFRAFDILKPPLVHQLEALPRGWGIVMDDIAAGVYAAVTSCFIFWVFTA